MFPQNIIFTTCIENCRKEVTKKCSCKHLSLLFPPHNAMKLLLISWDEKKLLFIIKKSRRKCSFFPSMLSYGDYTFETLHLWPWVFSASNKWRVWYLILWSSFGIADKISLKNKSNWTFINSVIRLFWFTYTIAIILKDISLNYVCVSL